MNSLPEDVNGKRLPPWLFLPEDTAVGTRLRPDVLLVHCPTHTGSGPVPQGVPKHTHIIEVGYSSDINMQDKEVLKAQQHAELSRLLSWTASTASTPTSLALLLCGTAAELTSEHIKRVKAKLNTHAVHYIQHLY